MLVGAFLKKGFSKYSFPVSVSSRAKRDFTQSPKRLNHQIADFKRVPSIPIFTTSPHAPLHATTNVESMPCARVDSIQTTLSCTASPHDTRRRRRRNALHCIHTVQSMSIFHLHFDGVTRDLHQSTQNQPIDFVHRQCQLTLSRDSRFTRPHNERNLKMKNEKRKT
jgi:hypothetical protein